MMKDTKGDWWKYLWLGITWDLKSEYRSIWLGWWLITWHEIDRWKSISISFQPGL